MSVTVLFVELVLTGFMVLAMVLLPFRGELSAALRSHELNEFHAAALSAAALGVAYLLGALCDRLADTLLDGMLRHNRARFAVKAMLKPQTREEKEAGKGRELRTDVGDPYAEDALRIALLAGGEEAASRENYLRSRLRLSRSVAVFGPGLTVAALVELCRARGIGGWPVAALKETWLELLGFCYLALPAVMSPLFARPPRTDEVVEKDYVGRRKSLLLPEARTVWARYWRAIRGGGELVRDVVCCTGTWGVLMLGVVALWFLRVEEWRVRGVAAGGLMLSALAGWVWWTIGGTLMSYLRDFARHREGGKGRAWGVRRSMWARERGGEGGT